MSVKVSSWVWQESGVGGNDLLIMLALADQADDAGKCWPSILYIARKVRLSRATVQRRLRALEAAGLIATCTKVGTSNRYQFTFNSPLTRDDGVPHSEGGLKLIHASPSEAGGASPSEAGGASPSEALIVSEPSGNRHSSQATAKRDTQFPDGFTFEDVRDWTIKSGTVLNADDFEQFKDHHLAKGSKMKDWHAAWRTWARRSKTFQRPNYHERGDWNPSLYGIVP